jgi:hypothetical protein
MVTRIVKLLSDRYSWPSCKKFVYSTCGTVCICIATIRAEALRLTSGWLASANAWLVGPKQVKFGLLLMWPQILVRLIAMSRELRLRLRTVVEQCSGRVRNLA